MPTNKWMQSSILLEVAKDTPQIWQRIIGQEIIHSDFGKGVVRRIVPEGDFIADISCFEVSFGLQEDSSRDGPTHKRIALMAFKAGLITEVSVWPDLAKDLEGHRKGKEQAASVERKVSRRLAREQKLEDAKKKREESEAKELVRLEQKYDASFYGDSEATSELYRILKKLDGEVDADYFSKSDTDWLEEKELFSILARICQIQGDPSKAETARRLAREQKLEESKRKAFSKLKQKYGVSNYRKGDTEQKLYRILKKLEEEVEGDFFSKSDTDWLKKEALNPILALIYEREGSLARAGSFWRKSGQPARALDITDEDSEAPQVLTMRGAAYADKGDFVNAEQSAQRSLQFEPDSYYTFNLLGRIYILTGRPIKGKNCFDKAKVLGADQDDVDKMIVNTLENAGKEDQRKAAKHFYDTEPERYQWVKRYLK